ncbi:hypothetical protein ES705_12001 [subsurface metagenome]
MFPRMKMTVSLTGFAKSAIKRSVMPVRESTAHEDQPKCELIPTCPYNSGLNDMPEIYREQYCRGNYRGCGRYVDYMSREPVRFSREIGAAWLKGEG